MNILSRQACDNESTFASEIVTFEGGLRLFSKRHDPGISCRYGYRRGVAFEAEVYRRILQPLGVTVPRFHGYAAGELLLEYLEAAARVSRAEDPRAMAEAARWIGEFQRCAPLADWLPRYDIGFYRGWAERAIRFGVFSDLAGQFERACELLAGAPVTMIHGEYYPANVLYRDGVVSPVDWESAAIGPGEIDLASLTDGWPEETVRDCEQAYGRGTPEVLAAARVYTQLRWLGDRPEWTGDPENTWRIERLRRDCDRL